jgi:3-oxoacyl-[acyl-carrier-protein] synthase-1
MTHTVRIVGFAGCTSLGYTLEPTLAAMGAGLSNFIDTGVANRFGPPVTAGALVDIDLPRAERLAALTRIGLADLTALLGAAGLSDAPLLLGVASDLTVQEQAAVQEALESCVVVHPPAGWFPYGRASALVAVAHAATLIRGGVHTHVAVGGVDSLCAPETVRALVRAERVLGPHVEGTIPGEAAVFALLARADGPHLPTSVLLEGEAQGRGTPFLERDRVSGDALAGVFRALREQGTARVDRIVAAHSGEGYFARSFSHAYLREVELMPEPLEMDLIADCVGDVGAASGSLGLAFGMYLMASPPVGAPGRVLIYSESDGGEIAAAAIAGAPASWQRQPAA